MIKNENYIVIHGWMLNNLKLSGNNLNVYAIIYGFTQEDDQWFRGNRQYLADWCGCTKRGIQKNLNYLLERNLIIKKETTSNNTACEYRCNPKYIG